MFSNRKIKTNDTDKNHHWFVRFIRWLSTPFVYLYKKITGKQKSEDKITEAPNNYSFALIPFNKSPTGKEGGTNIKSGLFRSLAQGCKQFYKNTVTFFTPKTSSQNSISDVAASNDLLLTEEEKKAWERMRTIYEKHNYNVSLKNETWDLISSIYRKLSLILHPDKNKDLIANNQFLQLTEDYRLLSNAINAQDKRKKSYGKSDKNSNYYSQDFEVNEFSEQEENLNQLRHKIILLEDEWVKIKDIANNADLREVYSRLGTVCFEIRDIYADLRNNHPDYLGDLQMETIYDVQGKLYFDLKEYHDGMEKLAIRAVAVQAEGMETKGGLKELQSQIAQLVVSFERLDQSDAQKNNANNDDHSPQSNSSNQNPTLTPTQASIKIGMFSNINQPSDDIAQPLAPNINQTQSNQPSCTG